MRICRGFLVLFVIKYIVEDEYFSGRLMIVKEERGMLLGLAIELVEGFYLIRVVMVKCLMKYVFILNLLLEGD